MIMWVNATIVSQINVPKLQAKNNCLIVYFTDIMEINMISDKHILVMPLCFSIKHGF
jgi:hypothetical protein